MQPRAPHTVTDQDVRRYLPARNKHAHKGAGGRVLIIGGSIGFHGAPILAGLAALRTGTDIVHLLVPASNLDSTRKGNPDIIVRAYAGDYFSEAAAQDALQTINSYDAIVIGPGLGTQAIDGVRYFVERCRLPLVIDADAIVRYEKLRPSVVLTPHQGEFKRLTGTSPHPTSVSKRCAAVQAAAAVLRATILLKGPTDCIATHTGIPWINTTGNEGMTIGGTGDVLAGTVGSLLGRGVRPLHAAALGSYIVGAAGDHLYTTMGIGFLASEVAATIPRITHNIMLHA